MPKVLFQLVDGSSRTVEIPVGTSIMRGAIDSNVPGIEADCGGCLSCATCHVYVDESQLGLLEPLTPEEEDMLASVAAARGPGSRLSCQLISGVALDGLRVRIPPRQS